MLDRMLPLFCCYYSPRQQLSLDEGMIPTKNRLATKQYIRYKPVRWGIKRFLLCEAKTGYILDAEIYRGWVKDRHWPLLGSAGSVVRRLVENSQVTNKNHMLFMDHFYNSIALFHLLKNKLGVLPAGTGMPSHKHYPKELGRRLTECGRYEFRCRGALCGPGCQRLVWPHTSGPRSLKNQLHSTWPPRPHSLARWPRTHSGCERALVHACGQACGRACWPAGMRPCLARGSQAAVA